MDNICRRFRECLIEYGKESLNGAVLLTPNDNDKEYYSNIKTLYCGTISEYKLANVKYKVSKHFEDLN
jgi:hypothetical protein